MRRFLGYWLLLSPAYAVVGALSSWLLLNLVDLTYEAFVALLLVPPAQALVLAASSRSAPLYPAGRPPLLVTAPLAVVLCVVAAGLVWPLDATWGVLASGSLQALLPRALAMLGGAALVVAGLRARKGRLPVAALGALLLLLGFDAVRPFLRSLPGTLLPKVNPFLGGIVTWSCLVALLFAAALAAQRALREPSPRAALLLGASLAVFFGTLHGALLQLFLHPWLDRPWSLLVPSALSVAAALAAAGGLAALDGPRERA